MKSKIVFVLAVLILAFALCGAAPGGKRSRPWYPPPMRAAEVVDWKVPGGKVVKTRPVESTPVCLRTVYVFRQGPRCALWK